MTDREIEKTVVDYFLSRLDWYENWDWTHTVAKKTVVCFTRLIEMEPKYLTCGITISMGKANLLVVEFDKRRYSEENIRAREDYMEKLIDFL